MYDPVLFAEKFQLATQSAQKFNPSGGLCGFELEWNLLDHQCRPLMTVGSGPDQQSFVDFLRADCIPPWSKEYSQLEVFNWMIEWATRPYFDPCGAIYEARLFEGMLINALHKAGAPFGEHLYYWHGNLWLPTEVNHQSIPGSWHLAKRRYLERCVDLYGNQLATAGIHTNLSLPDPLFVWDFMYLPAAERGDQHLDNFKSQFYITATRLMRAFAALFIATSASTPLAARPKDGDYEVVLTEFDSNRNLIFPNPPSLDVPDLYRSLEDYLRISYDLVRSGMRFGNNNWTPVRARSFAEPVERLILMTSKQLHDLYARGLYAAGQPIQVEEIAHDIEIQNLLARIDLPMARVEIRTDEGGHSLDLDIANLLLKHLLLIRFYADSDFARAFRYDREDILRARRNEELAARYGLRGEIENPFTAKPIGMRDFLRWTLEQIHPLAEAFGYVELLTPLMEMATGAPNTAEAIRLRLSKELGQSQVVPLTLLQSLVEEREAQVKSDLERIVERYHNLHGDEAKFSDFLHRARDDARQDKEAPQRFRRRPDAQIELRYPDKTSEIVDLAQKLIRIPSVTMVGERLNEVHRASTFIYDYARDYGLDVAYFDKDKYPALLINFPGNPCAPVMLCGHFDVVPPDPDDSQFDARIEGDYLWGRGAADMKTVVATYFGWMKDTLRKGGQLPPVNLLLIGNEENGESEPMGTPHVLKALATGENMPNGYSKDKTQYSAECLPKILIAGERTGEKGDELWGEICNRNRGVMRFDIIARGEKMHSGVSTSKFTNGKLLSTDLTERLLLARAGISELMNKYFTLKSADGWQSQARFPFIQVGTPGIYNITAGEGVLGVEIRPIPEDNLEDFEKDLTNLCAEQSLELVISVKENGITCNEDNPYLQALVKAVENCSGTEVKLGRKLPGTSARFAPHGQGVVWGQTGIGPHAANERHYIPSILPYYQALHTYAEILLNYPIEKKG
ncbi:MAG: M20/M25/M40 family metallo-hydrolase [Chloroflexi bacterium]|nr:M20/M25/M40 family metallo-hydrolase [Chloroflexota bacterium]